MAGAAWAAIPGVLRAYRGFNEVITTLMMVYVAVQLTNYLIEGPWLVPNSTWPATPLIPFDFKLPLIWPGTLVNGGAVLAIVGVAVLALVVNRTTFGLWLRAIGGNERASEVIGVPIRPISSRLLLRAGRSPDWLAPSRCWASAADCWKDFRPATASRRSRSPSSAA